MSAAGSSNRKHQHAGTVVRFAASDADYATAVIEAAGQVARASGAPRASKMGSAGDALTSGPRRASIVPGSASIGIPAHFKKSRNSRLNRGFEALWKRQVLSASKRRTGILPTLSDSQRNRAFPESLKTWHKTLQDNTQRFHGTVGTVLENYVTEEDWQASMDWRMELIHQEQEERWAVMEAQIQAQRTRKSSIMRRVDNLGQDFGVWTQDEDDDAPAVEDLGPLANPLRKQPLRPRPQPPKAPSTQRTARGVPPRRRQIKRLPARAPAVPVAPTPAPTPDAVALAIDDLRRVSCVPMMLSSVPRRTAMHSVAFQLNLPSTAGADKGAISATMPRSTFARASLAYMQPSSPVGPRSPGSMRPTMSRFAKNTLPSPTASPDGPVASVVTQPQNQQPSQHCALSQEAPGPTGPSASPVDVDRAADKLPPGLVPATDEDMQLILEYERAYIDGTATALFAARRDSQSYLAIGNMATAPSTPKDSQASNGSAVVKYPLVGTNSSRGRPEHIPGSKPGTPGSCKGLSKGLHTPRTPLRPPSSPTMTQVYLQFGGKSVASTPSTSRPQSRQSPGSPALSSIPLNSPFWDCPETANPAGSTQASLDPEPIDSPPALEREDEKAWAGFQDSNENCRLSSGGCDNAELQSKDSTAHFVIVPAAATCADGAQSPAEADNHKQDCEAPSLSPSSPDNDLKQHQGKEQYMQAVQTPVQTDSSLQRAGSSALQMDSASMVRSGSGRPVSARLWQSSSRLGSAGAGSSSSRAGAVILEDVQHAGHDGRGVDWDESEMVRPWAAEDYGQQANSLQQLSLLGPHLRSHSSTCASEYGGEGNPLSSRGTFTTPASQVKLMACAAYEHGTASPRNKSMTGMDAGLATRPSQHLHAAFKDRQAFSTPSMPGVDTAYTVQIGTSGSIGARSRNMATVTVDASSAQHTPDDTIPMQHHPEVPQTHCCKASGTQKVPSGTSLPDIRRSAPFKPALPGRHALPVPRDANNSGFSTTVNDPGRCTAGASSHQKRILGFAFPTLASPPDAHEQAAQHDRGGSGGSYSDDGGLPGTIQPLQPQIAVGDHASLSTHGAHDQLNAQPAHPKSQGARAGVIHPVPRPLAGCPPYGMPTNPLQFGKHRLHKGKTPPITQAMAWITAWHDHSIRSEDNLQRVVSGTSPLPLGVLEEGC